MAQRPTTSGAQPVIHVKELHKHYRMGAETIRALNGVDCTASASDFSAASGRRDVRPNSTRSKHYATTDGVGA